MSWRGPLLAGIAVVALAGCGAFSRSGASGPYLATRLCGVHIDGKTHQTHLRLVLAVLRPLPRNGVLEVEFENPSRDPAALVVTRRVGADERTVEVLSPPLKDLRPREYDVTARVYAAADRKQMLALHTQRCESLIDQRDLLR